MNRVVDEERMMLAPVDDIPDCSVLSVVFSALTLLIGLWEWHKSLVPFLKSFLLLAASGGKQ